MAGGWLIVDGLESPHSSARGVMPRFSSNPCKDSVHKLCQEIGGNSIIPCSQAGSNRPGRIVFVPLRVDYTGRRLVRVPPPRPGPSHEPGSGYGRYGLLSPTLSSRGGEGEDSAMGGLRLGAS